MKEECLLCSSPLEYFLEPVLQQASYPLCLFILLAAVFLQVWR